MHLLPGANEEWRLRCTSRGPILLQYHDCKHALMLLPLSPPTSCCCCNIIIYPAIQQLFFQLTELVPCFFIVTLLDKQNYKQLLPLVPLLGLAVNTAHVLLALKERVLWGLFVSGVNTVNGRDVMLMAGDISCLVFFGSLLHRAKASRQELVQLATWGVCTVVVLVVVYVVGLGYVYQ